jgi:hypothetical protein
MRVRRSNANASEIALPGPGVGSYDAAMVRTSRHTFAICAVLVLCTLAAAASSDAQGKPPSAAPTRSPEGAAPTRSPEGAAPTRSPEEAERDRAIVEALRREDPAEADRYVALSDARVQAMAELRRTEIQYNAAGPELRSVFAASLRRAQHKYGEAALAILDFFDARDRRAISRYQEEIKRIDQFLEERQRNRAELQKLLGP